MHSPNPMPSAGAQKALGAVSSVQVGSVRRLGRAGATDPLHRPWRSAFLKSPIHGAVEVGPLGLAGDEQADTKHHGGPNQAVLMYCADHFELWRREHGLEGLDGGGFGENLTVSGFAEPDVCIGDRLRVGSVLLEVSQPRQPCGNIDRRWGRKGITQAVTTNGRGGWYLRVLETGSLQAGDTVMLVERPHPVLTIHLATDALYGRCSDPSVLQAFLAAEQMPDGFKHRLAARLAEPAD